MAVTDMAVTNDSHIYGSGTWQLQIWGSHIAITKAVTDMAVKYGSHTLQSQIW